MNNLRPLIVMLTVPAVLLGVAASAPALDYAESSNGLSVPQWEGGHTELEMVDVNLDGRLDLISIGDHGSPYINTQEHGVMVYFGDGMGNWSNFMYGNFGYGGIAVGDCNGDGLPDIGYGMHHNYNGGDLGDQLIEVALGDGSGRMWTPWDDSLATHGETYGMFATDFGDVDNDGDLDIACTSFGYGNQLMIYLNLGTGVWRWSAALAGGNCGMVVEFGDVNNDGILDLATSYSQGTVFFGNGDGTFTNASYNLPSPGNSWHSGVTLGDIDNDGCMDLAYCGDNGGIKVWRWDGAGTQWVDVSGQLAGTSNFEYAQLRDMNSDGYCDVAAGGRGRVQVWLGDGAGNWTQAANYVIANDPDCYFEAFRAGGDIDHNGFPDIVHLTDEGTWINSYNHLRLYRETARPRQLAVRNVFPKGRERFIGGGVRFIDWLCAVPQGDSAVVNLDFSASGSAGPWTPAASELPNNGRYQWTVPTGVNSPNCFIRITAISGSDTAVSVNPAPFSVLSPGAPNLSITLTPVNPPILIPAGGGSFAFEARIDNNLPLPVSFDGWTEVTLPNGGLYSPLVLRQGLTLPANGFATRVITQTVPGSAPPGSYLYIGNTGAYQGLVVSFDSFPFTKLGGDASPNHHQGWACCGWFDEDEFSILNSQFLILSSSPNPFNASTALSYELQAASQVKLVVYDIVGREVSVLVDGYSCAGTHQAVWDATGMASGIYFCALEAEDFKAVKKLILLK